jgi:hypothetical protein
VRMGEGAVDVQECALYGSSVALRDHRFVIAHRRVLKVSAIRLSLLSTKFRDNRTFYSNVITL